MQLFCFGYGYVAQHIAAASTQPVYGTQRLSSDQSPLFAYHGDAVLSAAAQQTLRQSDAVLISIPPDQQGCPVARHADVLLHDKSSLRWVGYLSTTGVYGDTGGDWVDEASPLRPTSERAAQRILAEQQWLDWGQENNIPVHIFRLSGIYGPNRSPFERIAQGDNTIIHAPGHIFNRIHVADIAQIIAASMHTPEAGAIYNVSDDLPASQEDVMHFAYDLLQQPTPKAIPLSEASLSPMAREFYFDCKRVCNEKVKNDLGVTLLYPTYVEGLTALYKDKDTQPS